MAYASWAHPSKTQGNGDDSVSWSGSPHTGRVQRTTQAVFSAAGVTPKTLTINQAGKSEFVDMDDTASVVQEGGNISIGGTSNSSKLTFSKANDGIGITLPSSYTAAGATTNNGAAITGDPGASAQFNFSLLLSGITQNPGVTPRTCQIIVTDNAGHTDTCLITQAAGDAYLTISPVTLDLAADGTAQSVSVSSNTSWSIS